MVLESLRDFWRVLEILGDSSKVLEILKRTHLLSLKLEVLSWEQTNPSANDLNTSLSVSLSSGSISSNRMANALQPN